MPRPPASNNKGPRLPTNNNEDIQKTAAKQLPSYYGVTRAPNVSDPLILGPSKLDVRSRDSKRTTRNKDSLTTTVNTATKKQNESDPLIPVVSTESIRICESERINNENNDNKRDGTPTCIRAIGRRHFQINRKIVTESDSDESEKDEMDNAINKNTKEKELGTSNSSIKVHIPRSLVWLNLSALNSTKQKLTSSPVPSMLNPAEHNPQSSPYQTELEEDQYLVSPSPGDQFATNVESNNKDNNAVTTIKRLFLNIGHRLSYKMLMEKTVYETGKFFIHSARHMSSKDRVALCGIRLGLRSFQALGIFSMLQIKVDTGSRGIFADKMGYGKVRYLIFWKFVTNIIRRFNV